MNLAVLITFCLIVLARITDVSLDTIRMVSVIQGRRAFAAVLGFFEAGVGENSAQVRELVCQNLGHLGLRLDCAANSHCKPDADVAQGDSPARILVISSREDLTILREARQVIRSDARWKAPPRELELTPETV